MIEIIGYVSLVWVGFSWLKILVEKYLPNYIKFLCMKCITFWTLLIIFMNPIPAAMGSLIAYIIEQKIMNEINL